MSLSTVQKALAENDLATLLRELNPYPADIFTEPTDEEWKSAAKVLTANGIVPDRIFGKWGRMVWNNCVNQLKEMIEESDNYRNI